MYLANHTNLRPSYDLTRLAQFVIKYCDNADLAQVDIDVGYQLDQHGRPACGGLAYRDGDTYTVAIGLDPRATYPRTQRLNLKTPCVRFESWQAEFVMVLAHELRHIDQFALGAFMRGQELEAEIDAEVFAAAVLEAWRESTRYLTQVA
jgi:hypothetical protein